MSGFKEMRPRFFSQLAFGKDSVMSQQYLLFSIILLVVPAVGDQRGVSESHAGDAHDGHNATSNHTDTGSHGHRGSLHVVAVAYKEVRDPLIFTIVVLLTGISKIGYHHANFLSSKIPESCILIILGTVFGAIIHFSGVSKDLPDFFRPHEFFIFLLPPIILEAAFSLHDRTFTENIGSILLFAVLGTVLACIMLGGTLYGLAQVGAVTDMSFLKIMVFSSLIVAVDPVAVLAVFNEIGVNRVLYFLVFGESLLNDGVTVVLYKVFQAYSAMNEITAVHIILGIVKFFVVCLGGLLLGVLAGIATAILTKYATRVKVVQPIIIYTMAYFGFLMAELFEFSGIISIIGCGLTQMQYAFHNISDKSSITVKYFTKVISSASEIIIFLFLGLSIVHDDHDWRTGFTLWTIFFCLVYRFIIVFAMSFAINCLDVYRVRRISLHEQFMIAYGGLRGAVCFSLAVLLDPNDFPEKKIFVTTTLAVIIFTVFVQGITIKPLVYILQISLAPEKSRTMYKELNSHVTDHLMAGIEDIIGDHGRNHLREKMEYIDGRYLKPLLQVTPDPRDSQLRVFYENLLLKEHYNYLKLSGAKTPGDIPQLPHVNTQLLLSSLTGNNPHMAELPVLERTEIEYTPKRLSQPAIRSAPATPAITIEVDTEGTLFRRGRGKRSMSVDADINAKGLRSLLMSQRNSRLVLAKYDRNLTSNEDMHTEICKKTRKNRHLERLFSQDASASSVQRRKSWSDSDAQVCEERTQVHKAPPRHAMTVDLGNTNRFGVGDDSFLPGVPFSPVSPLDSVFEEDEGAEVQPMLEGEKGRKMRGSIKSSKYRLERQMGLDKTSAEGKRALPEQENAGSQTLPSCSQEQPEEKTSSVRSSNSETTV